MKKLFAAIALGTFLVAGFMFTQGNQPADTATMEWEPTVFSMSKTAPGFSLF